MNGILLLAVVKAHYTGSHDWEDAIDVSYLFSSKRFAIRLSAALESTKN